MSGPIASVAPTSTSWSCRCAKAARRRGQDGLASSVATRGTSRPGPKNPEPPGSTSSSCTPTIPGGSGPRPRRRSGSRRVTAPSFPSLTGSKTADQIQIDEFYEPVAGPFDDAVQLFPQILEQSQNREIGKSPVAGQLEDIMADEAVEPALRRRESRPGGARPGEPERPGRDRFVLGTVTGESLWATGGLPSACAAKVGHLRVRGSLAGSPVGCHALEEHVRIAMEAIPSDGPGDRARAPKSRLRMSEETRAGWLAISPWIFGFIVFTVFPFLPRSISASPNTT